MRFWLAVEEIRYQFYGDEPEVHAGKWDDDERLRIKSRKERRRYSKGEKRRGFDIDSRIQVFETTIRVLGGLLSGHLYAIGEFGGVYPPPENLYINPNAMKKRNATFDWAVVGKNAEDEISRKPYKYSSHLLDLAHDLGERLLPSFELSETGIPYPRVNLRHGLQFRPGSSVYCEKQNINIVKGDKIQDCYEYEREGKYYKLSPFYFPEEDLHGGDPEYTPEEEITREEPDNIKHTCPAGAGSLVLEMTVLSRLTGDGRFEEVAKKAFDAVWKLRSGIGLLGAGLWVDDKAWAEGFSGVSLYICIFFHETKYSFRLVPVSIHFSNTLSNHIFCSVQPHLPPLLTSDILHKSNRISNSASDFHYQNTFPRLKPPFHNHPQQPFPQNTSCKSGNRLITR